MVAKISVHYYSQEENFWHAYFNALKEITSINWHRRYDDHGLFSALILVTPCQPSGILRTASLND